MSNVDHVQVTCYRDDCHAVITLHRQDYNRLQESHATFWCPVGHGQHFSGKSEKEKRIAELEREVEWARRSRDRWADHYHEMVDVVGQVRSGAVVCPFGCGWSTSRRLSIHQAATEGDDGETVARFFDRVWGDLREHLEHDHNATAKVRLLTERAEAHP